MVDGTADDLLLRAGAALFLLRGEGAFFVGEVGSFAGDAGSMLGIVASGSKIWAGSILSPVRVRRALVDFFGDVSTLAVVCLRVDLRGLARFGAGVNS